VHLHLNAAKREKVTSLFAGRFPSAISVHALKPGLTDAAPFHEHLERRIVALSILLQKRDVIEIRHLPMMCAELDL